MGMYSHLTNFFDKITQDDSLLRLLMYKPEHADDDPLSPTKPDIIGSSNYIKAITEHILRAPKSTDLEQKTMCRICMYLSYNTESSNIKVFNQDIVFDVYAHIDDYEKLDCRSLKICDRLNDLLHEERVSGIGKVVSSKTYLITNAPNGYIGYKMVFSFGSTK